MFVSGLAKSLLPAESAGFNRWCPVASGRIVLTGTSDGINGRVWRSAGVMRVGRLPELEILLDHSTISRLHAEILVEARGWVVVDLGSTNGTFLNGIRVTRAGQPLRAGDVLQFGHLIVKVTEIEADIRDTQLLSAERLKLTGVREPDVGGGGAGPVPAGPAGRPGRPAAGRAALRPGFLRPPVARFVPGRRALVGRRRPAGPNTGRS